MVKKRIQLLTGDKAGQSVVIDTDESEPASNDLLCDHVPMLIYSESEAIKQMDAGVFTCRRCGCGISWDKQLTKYVGT